MNPYIPAWILGAPFIGIIILNVLFKGQSAMGGNAPRYVPRGQSGAYDNVQDVASPRRSV